jgi:hypothetical protein
MTKQELEEQYRARASAEFEAGGRVEIDRRFDYVGIVLSDETEYFFQGEEASGLLDEIEAYSFESLDDKDALLAIAQSW